MIPVRYSELWPLLVARITTPTLMTLLNGGKVYVEGQDYSVAEGPEGGQWGRVVVVPTSTAWPIVPVPGQLVKLGVLIRSEVNNYENPNYVPQVALEAVQIEINKQLAGWVAPSTTGLRLAFPMYIATPWQPLPLWDDDRGVYFLSSVYRTEVQATRVA